MRLRPVPLSVEGGVRTRILRVCKEIYFGSAERLVMNEDLGVNGYILRLILACCSPGYCHLDLFLLVWWLSICQGFI
jgi:hypothetical protein